MDKSVKSKVFATNFDAWNNEWRVYVATPFIVALGVLIGSILNVYFASSELGQALVMGFFLGVTWVVGLILLALVD